MKQLDLEPAYVIHTRPYRDTSLLVESFTQDYGRVSWVARGVRRAKSRTAGLLQPFVSLYLSGKGRGELLALHQVESRGPAITLSGQRLFCGYYLNELLLRLLQPHDTCLPLFAVYSETLQALAEASSDEELILRRFEWQLLRELGYALHLEQTTDTQEPIQATQYYTYIPHHALVKTQENTHSNAFLGESLLAISQAKFDTVKPEAKRLLRIAIHSLLGGKPLNSRELFSHKSRD